MSKLEKMGDKRDRLTLKATIEMNLRKVYQDALGEEVPDRFRVLLDQLRQQAALPVAASDAPAAPPEDGT